jgi:hypothetical protein
LGSVAGALFPYIFLNLPRITYQPKAGKPFREIYPTKNKVFATLFSIMDFSMLSCPVIALGKIPSARGDLASPQY